MSKVQTVVSKVKPLLEEYALQLKGIEDGIRKNGTISSDICAKCSQRNIVKTTKFDENVKVPLESLLAWIRENEIQELSSSGEVLAFRSAKKKVEGIEGSIPLLSIGSSLVGTTEKVVYDYRISVAKLKRKEFVELLKNAFSSFRTCSHVSDQSTINYLALVSKTQNRIDFESRAHRVEQLWQKPDTVDTYMVLCKECYDRIDSIGCEESIKKEGFVFVNRCPIRKILFQNLLEKHGIKYVSGEKESFYERDDLMFSLPELKTFVTGSDLGLEPTIESLKPDTLLAFGGKNDLPRFLGFDTDVILFNPIAEKDALIIFDKNAPVETSEERIIDKIISNIDSFSATLRGKEHDRLVEAFRKIGEELGYITEAEMSQKGSRVDVVWYNRNGKVEVAIEVETSAQWKKDIVTTWETSPKLAVILTHYKTDKATEDIIQYNLLQYMPHRLLFISFIQRKAYLVEKGNIIKTYAIKSER